MTHMRSVSEVIGALTKPEAKIPPLPCEKRCFILEYMGYCGALAQLVEQRPEEPCVPSSSLGGATKENTPPEKLGYFL